MGNFSGYLLKAVKTNTVFPDKYIEADQFDSTPNSREEIKAYRDENTRDLTRITAEGMKSTWSLKTRKHLHLADLETIRNFFYDAEEEDDDPDSNHRQRRVELEFWDMENLEYRTAYFYRPDIKYTVHTYTDNDIIFNEITIEGVEY